MRLVEDGQSIAAAARTLGVVEQTLFNWVKAQREGKLTGADSKVVSAQQMEIRPTACRAGAREDGARHIGKGHGVLRESAAVKYAVVQRHRRVWPISVQCRVLRISVTGCHEHVVRKAGGARRRHLSDDALLVHIKPIHAETRGGYPRSAALAMVRHATTPRAVNDVSVR